MPLSSLLEEMSVTIQRFPLGSKAMLSGLAKPVCGPPAAKTSKANSSASGSLPDSVMCRICP
jgi:hypothetical protein